ncbi:DUF4266 domain-containing protein [Maribacter chungangensis]|uniref:DUF4266 domain-containing protein n=1 Tax=Maribacter chungangensis TaxID=1069117 RepID=A0ABW3BAB0_9FLAO
MTKTWVFILLLSCTFGSCVVVKEYEKVAINDPDMGLYDQPCDRNVVIAHTYREGAAGANGGQTGGGCGCN